MSISQVLMDRILYAIGDIDSKEPGASYGLLGAVGGTWANAPVQKCAQCGGTDYLVVWRPGARPPEHHCLNCYQGQQLSLFASGELAH